jgi:plasmid stabilization system protein ParE
MSFSVEWSRRAENELAELWTGALDRRAITQSVDLIDRLLKRDPLSCGESRDRKQRLLIELPLAVLYQVGRRRGRVGVISIARWRQAH